MVVCGCLVFAMVAAGWTMLMIEDGNQFAGVWVVNGWMLAMVVATAGAMHDHARRAAEETRGRMPPAAHQKQDSEAAEGPHGGTDHDGHDRREGRHQRAMILIGSLAAFSLAQARRRDRTSAAWEVRTLPMSRS